MQGDSPTDGLRVLVTGASGFVGAHVVAAFEAAEACGEVVAWTRGDGDVATQAGADALQQRLRESSIDVVVHLAGLIGPGPATADPAGAVAANAGATLLVARACAAAGARLVLGSTTDAAWPAGHSNIYALTKAWSEQAALLAAPAGLQVARLCGPYGPGLPPGAARNALVNMARQALTGERMPAWRGVERRWCHVTDIAAAIVALAIAGPRVDGEVVDIGRNDLHALADTARAICTIAGVDEGLVDEIDPPAGVGHGDAPLDLARIEVTGWTPLVSLDDGLAGLVAWVRELDAVPATGG